MMAGLGNIGSNNRGKIELIGIGNDVIPLNTFLVKVEVLFDTSDVGICNQANAQHVAFFTVPENSLFANGIGTVQLRDAGNRKYTRGGLVVT